MNDSIDSGGSRNAPSEFQLLPYGKIELEGEGSAILDNPMMDQIINNFERRGNDMVVDYEHQSLKDTQAPAAGWVKRLVNRGEKGLWAIVAWTEKAKQYLESGEYRYFSPVFSARKSDGKVMKIMNVALTNSPKINHLNPIIAKDDNCHPDLFLTTLKIAKDLYLREDGIMKYEGMRPDFDGVDESAILKVAKLMGNTEEDIRGYGGMGKSVRRGVYVFTRVARKRTYLDIIWHLVRSHRSFNADDIERLSGANRATVAEYLQCLVRAGYLRKPNRTTWHLVKDPGPETPVNSTKCKRLKRLRARKEKTK